jgi:hypothetical protein
MVLKNPIFTSLVKSNIVRLMILMLVGALTLCLFSYWPPDRESEFLKAYKRLQDNPDLALVKKVIENKDAPAEDFLEIATKVSEAAKPFSVSYLVNYPMQDFEGKEVCCTQRVLRSEPRNGAQTIYYLTDSFTPDVARVTAEKFWEGGAPYRYESFSALWNKPLVGFIRANTEKGELLMMLEWPARFVDMNAKNTVIP